MKLIFAAGMLWTIFAPFGETVLQFGTEQECRDAIEQGLPYLGVPPKEELSCRLRADQNPVEKCGGEGVIYSAGWSYAHGCGYPHEDVEAHTCTTCNGAGGWLDQAASKAKAAAEKVAEDSKIDPADLHKPVTI